MVRIFVDSHPEEAARAIEGMSHRDAVRLFEKLPSRVVVPLCERVSPHWLGSLIAELGCERRNEILTSVDPRVAALSLRQLEEPDQSAILRDLPEGTARRLQELADYPEETAGGMMESRVASLSIDQTVQQAIASIRKAPRDALHYLYVTRRDGELVGVINMRDLLLAAPRDPIEPLIRRNVVSVAGTMPRDEVVARMRDTRFLALPVVDLNRKLIGVVMHDEALEAGQAEAFEDLQKMVGAGRDERALSPLPVVIQSRLPWLYVNLGTAFLASAVVGLFEQTIAETAALAVLLPVVAGQGGNTGSQSLAVVMRGLALREIVPSANRKVIAKELYAGLINGLLIAMVTAAVVFAWRMITRDSFAASAGLAAVIGLAMVINMAVAAISGAAIPLALRAMGRDPAQSAAIFLTTVTDIVGFASFLGLAELFHQWIR
jgi:magnesium transporter